MTWGAIGGAVVGGAVSMMSDSGGGGGGGAGSQTQSKEPWAPAQPWIMNNLVAGQNLQQAYTAQPFSNQQAAAYGNQNAQSDYMRGVVPSLIGQISGQQVGFDRSNPNARPKAFDFNALGNINSLRGTQMQNIQGQTPQIAPPPAPAAASPVFVQQGGSDLDFGRNALMRNFTSPEGFAQGSYGSYKYGDPITAANETDARMYLLLGGVDPYNQLNGLRVAGQGGGLLHGGFGGPSTGVDGIGVAGSDASVGSSANF